MAGLLHRLHLVGSPGTAKPNLIGVPGVPVLPVESVRVSGGRAANIQGDGNTEDLDTSNASGARWWSKYSYGY